MKKFLVIALSALVVISCQKDELNSAQEPFRAEIEEVTGNKTRTDATLAINWCEGDCVNIWAGTSVSDKYVVSGESVGKNVAELSLVSTGEPSSSAKSFPANVACYPYSDNLVCAESNGNYSISGMELPSTQTYLANSFAEGVFPMVAVTGSVGERNFGFKNVCGVLRIQLDGTELIKSVSVSGNNGEVISGAVEINTAHREKPTIKMLGDGKTVTLDCGNGIDLDVVEKTTFDIVLPPVTFTKGFTITVNGDTQFVTEKSQTITRSRILCMETKIVNAFIHVESVELNKTALELTEDGTETLTATINPAGASDKTVSWSSSDENVATVSDGKVTAVNPGTATITVTSTDGEKTATCEVTVIQTVYPVTSVSLDKTTLELTEGDSETLSATVLPDNATDPTVSWKSSDENVATVSDGKVTAIKPGTATITVTTTDGGKTATCDVTVNKRIFPVTSVSLDKTTLELTEGDSETLSATVLPDNATDPTVSWKSSDENVATVSDGKVTAIKPGTATITVTTTDGNKTATCEVTVNKRIYPVTSVSLNKTTLELTEGDSETLTFKILPENATDKTVSWKSSDENVATVSDGKVTAVKPGTATITVTTTDGNKIATCEVTVNKRIYPVTGVDLDKTSLVIYVGNSASINATVKPDNASNKNVTWKSSDESVATVDKNGEISALKKGTATITVTTEDGGFTAECKIEVKTYVDVKDAGFKSYCLNNFDKDSDGYLSTEEAEAITAINYSAKTVDLQNLDSFKNIQSLILKSPEASGTLSNYSTIFKLSKLKHLECTGYTIDKLDLSKMPDLEYLDCYNDYLETLDVSYNNKLTHLDCSPMTNDRLSVLLICTGQVIPNVTVDRNVDYIPENTTISVSESSGGGDLPGGFIEEEDD